MTTVALRNAIEAVHSLVDPEPPWRSILTTARDLVGADAATVVMFGKEQELLMFERTGIDAAAEREYQEHFYQSDTLGHVTVDAPAGTWWDNTRILPAREMARNEYHAFLKRARIGQVLALIAQNDEFQRVALSFQRVTPRAAALSNCTEGELAEYTRAFLAALARRSQESLARLDAIQATFASFGEATFLSTRAGVVGRLSPLAADLLRQAKMIAGCDGALTHPDPAMARSLRLALERATDTNGSVIVTVPVAWGETYRLDISLAHASIKLGTERILFVRIHKNSAFALPDADELCAAFGLTAAEGRVLQALVAGHAPNDYAAIAGVTKNTVRNQVAALMRKMGCNRQSELVRLGSLLR